MNNNIEQHKYSELIYALSEHISTLQGKFSFEAQQVVADILQNADTFTDEKWSQILKNYGNRSEVITAIYDNQSSPKWVIENASKKQPVRMYQKEFLLKNNNTPDEILNEILFNYGNKEYLEFYNKNYGGTALNNFIAREIIEELIQNNYRIATPHKLIAIERCTDADLITNFLDKCKNFEHINEDVLTAIVNNSNMSDENRLIAFEMGCVPEKIKRLPNSIKEEVILSQIEYYKTIEKSNLEITPLTEFLKGLLENDTLSPNILMTLFNETYLNKGGPFYNQFQIFPLDVVSKINDINVLHEISNHYDELEPVVKKAFLENNNLDNIIKNTLLLNVIHGSRITDTEFYLFQKFIQEEPLWDNSYETFLKRVPQVSNEFGGYGLLANATEGLLIRIALSEHTPEKYLDEILSKFDEDSVLSHALATMQKIARLHNQDNISNYLSATSTAFLHTGITKSTNKVENIERFNALIDCIDEEINKSKPLYFIKDSSLETIKALLKEMKFKMENYLSETYDEKIQTLAYDIIEAKASFYHFVKNIDKYQQQFMQIKENQNVIENTKGIKQSNEIKEEISNSIDSER